MQHRHATVTKKKKKTRRGLAGQIVRDASRSDWRHLLPCVRCCYVFPLRALPGPCATACCRACAAARALLLLVAAALVARAREEEKQRRWGREGAASTVAHLLDVGLDDPVPQPLPLPEELEGERTSHIFLERPAR